MGVSSLLPLIKYVCLDPTAPHAFLLSWIRQVNVAVPMTWTSDAPGGLDGIVALTSSTSFTGIDGALLYSGRLVCVCVEYRHQPTLFRFVCWGLTISLRIKRTDDAMAICGFSHNTIAPTSPSSIHCYYKIYKLFSSFSLTQPHFPHFWRHANISCLAQITISPRNLWGFSHRKKQLPSPLPTNFSFPCLIFES